MDLGKVVAVELLKRNTLEGQAIDDILLGNVLSAGSGQNIARQVAMTANIPPNKTAMTVNMVCGSGLRAVTLATQSIKTDDVDRCASTK